MKNKLELQTKGKELLDVTTFGSFQSTRKTYIVSFSLPTEKENIKIKALVTPIICLPLSVMMKNLKIPPELKGLKLADRLQSSQNLDVDIIIGNDYYG